MLAFMVLMFSAYNCQKTEIIDNHLVSNEVASFQKANNLPPEPNFTTPEFPAIALYIIHKEYVMRHPEIKTTAELEQNMKGYLEQRLIDLYPEIAYIGVVDASLAEISLYMNEWNQFLAANPSYEQEYKIPATLAELNADIAAIELEPKEIAMFQELDSYAMLKDRLVTRSELDDLCDKYDMGTSKAIGTIGWVLIGAAGAITAYTVVCALISANRARNTAEQNDFYGTALGTGNNVDAYRHIFASMNLRRMVGVPLAALVGWGNEARRSNNPCHDREMDLHNNRVGRVARYNQFRNGTTRWRRHAERVRDFVNNPNANGQIMNWPWNVQNLPSTTDCTQVITDVNNTANNIYIIYN